MTYKFNRNYFLSADTENGKIVIDYKHQPFTIEFDITRNTQSSANTCQIRIYNLSEENRNKLRFNVSDYGTYRNVTLLAGYNDDLSTVFSGNINQAYSVREGVNFITYIECFDGGFAFVNGKISKKNPANFPAGTPYSTIIKQLMLYLPHVDFGAIGDFPDKISRQQTYTGNVVDILQELTNKNFFIQNEKSYALKPNEYIKPSGFPLRITSDSGLLGTPTREQTIISFDMVFEPSLNVGSLVVLTSQTANNFSGQYKVISVKHRGMISPAVCGSVITTGQFYNNKQLVPV